MNVYWRQGKRVLSLQGVKKDGSWKGKQSISLLAFDLHNKEVGDGNGIQRVTTIVYEIRTLLADAAVLKSVKSNINEYF